MKTPSAQQLTAVPSVEDKQSNFRVDNDTNDYQTKKPVNKNPKPRRLVLNFILSNARSLAPKIVSLLDYFSDLDLHFSIITESWLKPGWGLENDIVDLNFGQDIDLLHKSRQSRRGRTAGGGVAILFNKKKIRLVERPLKMGKAEVICASGKVPGIARKIVIFGIYLPPRTRAPQVQNLMESLRDEISKIKTEMDDPIIVLAGDYNKKPFRTSIVDFPDINVLETGHTRGNEILDYVMTNIPDCSTKVRPPLESPSGRLKSDHMTVSVSALVGTEHRFTTRSVKSRPKTKKGDLNFAEWLKKENWTDVLNAANPDDKASLLARKLDSAMDNAYPVKTRKIRSCDDPWITPEIKARIRSRKRTFGKSFRSSRWREKKRETTTMIRKSKSEYYQKFSKIAAQTGDSSLYFKVVNRLKDRQAPKLFCVTDLFHGKDPEVIAETVADFFAHVGRNFSPLTEHDLPPSDPSSCFLQVREEEVVKRLRECKKPRGLLHGDIFPELITLHAEKLSPVITHVLNASYAAEIWPAIWKCETVTSIPKKSNPEDLSELRNISCTPLLSKLMEYFVLERLKTEVYPAKNQYGGLQGCGTTHYLIEAWDRILEPLDRDGRAVNLISIDFAKAFNSMGHQACVRSLIDHGASTHSTRLVGAFLTDRSMRFKAANALSTPRQLRGGSPQGTLLGNFMFVMTTNKLEIGELLPQPSPRQRSPPLTDYRATQPSPGLPTLGHAPVDDPLALSPGNSPVDTSSSDHNTSDDSFTYLQEFRRPYNRIDDSSESLNLGDLPEGEDDSDPADDDMAVLKYVDDFLGSETLETERGTAIFSQNKTQRFLHARGSQDFFNTVNRQCTGIGMTVNSKKTQMITINAASSEDVRSFIKTTDGDTILSQDSLKVLGFVFGTRPNVQPQVDHMCKKFRARVWVLRHLKKIIDNKDELKRLYMVLVLPVLDYAAVVYHSQLTREQAATLEDLQTSALKIIYGFGHSKRALAEMSGVETLWERRERLVDKFLTKSAQNSRFADDWFPQKTFHHMDLRKELIYHEKYARTERLYKSPKYFLRRRLNGGLN